MRRSILGEVVATLVAWAIFLVPFAVFGLWRKPLESRIAAMAISSFILYGTVLLFRIFITRRDWDRPADVVVVAAFAATITLMGWWGTLVALLTISVWGLAWGIRSVKQFLANNRRWSWERLYFLTWGQFIITFVFLFWLGSG
jgi:hypothetical protein